MADSRHRAGWALLKLAALCMPLLGAVPTHAQTVVERRLAATQPCGALSHEVFGVRVAIDKLESITLSRANLDMAGDVVTLTLSGGLACKTSDAAVIKGGASVHIDADARMDLSDCSIKNLEITATKFEGQFAPIIQAAWAPAILPKIDAETREMLKQACTKFVVEP